MITQKQIIPHIFSSLLRLERSHAILKSRAPRKGAAATRAEESIREQAKILKKMRRTANLIQFAVARKNQVETTKLLKIYYAMNQMILPEMRSQLHSSSASRLRAISNAH